jgi:hypothetical protein
VSNQSKTCFVLLLGLTLGACASAPLQKPINAGEAATGVGTLESVRKQLEGSWTLVSYEILQNGRRQRLDAAAEMTYDQFGNLNMIGELKNPDASSERRPALLNYSGRAVIDVDKSELRFVVENSRDPLPRSVEANVKPENVRHFTFRDSLLELTISDTNGQATGFSTWKRKA